MATAHDEIKAEAESLGFSFLRKPFSMKTLASEMRQSARAGRSKTAAAGPATQEQLGRASKVTLVMPVGNQLRQGFA